MALWIPSYGIRTGRPRVRPSDFYNAARSLGQGTKAPWMWDGLVGWWPFVAGGGDKAYDFSGHGNHGDLEASMNDADWVVNDGSEPRLWLPRALDFDGTDDYVGISGAGTDLDTNTDKTLSVWINVGSNPSTYHRALTKNRNSGGLGFAVAYNSVSPTGWHVFFNDGTEYVENVGSLGTNTWHHVSAVYDETGGSLTAYLDGISVDNSEGTGWGFASNDNLEIGRRTGVSQYFPGLLSDVRIYNRALSASEVSQLYDHGSHIVEPRPTLVSFAEIAVSGSPWYYNLQQRLLSGSTAI